MPHQLTSVPLPASTLSERDAAAYIAMTIYFLRRARYSGQGPAYVKMGRRSVRYRVADLEAWLTRNRIDPSEPLPSRRARKSPTRRKR